MKYFSLNHDQHGRKIKRKKPQGRVYGKYKASFEPIESTKTQTYADIRMAESGNYPSNETRTSFTTKTERLQYTGTLVKGISTMHKSNAVPIINQEEALDHARMRR